MCTCLRLSMITFSWMVKCDELRLRNPVVSQGCGCSAGLGTNSRVAAMSAWTHTWRTPGSPARLHLSRSCHTEWRPLQTTRLVFTKRTVRHVVVKPFVLHLELLPVEPDDSWWLLCRDVGGQTRGAGAERRCLQGIRPLLSRLKGDSADQTLPVDSLAGRKNL